MTTKVKTFAQRLQELCKQHRLKKSELAEKLGVPVNNITQFLTGKRQPNLHTLIKLSHIFQMTLDSLLTNTQLGRYGLVSPAKKPTKSNAYRMRGKTEYNDLFNFIYPSENPPNDLLEKATQNRAKLEEFFTTWAPPRVATVKIRSGFDTGLPVSLKSLHHQLGTSRLNIIKKNQRAWKAIRRFMKAEQMPIPAPVLGIDAPYPEKPALPQPVFQASTPTKDRLKAIREWRGYSIQTVGAKTNVSRHHISAYERGKYTPKPWTLQQLAQLYSVPLQMLLSEGLLLTT